MSGDAWRGAAIREARKNKGLTQERLGELVGVTPQAVSKWENGESAPDINTVPPLCDALGISADEFLRGRGTQAQPSDPLMKGFGEWLQQQRERDGCVPSLSAVFRKLVAVVEEAGVPSWQGDVLVVRSHGGRPTDVTLLTRQGSVLHWAGADDLPDPAVSDEAIADALRSIADPEMIRTLRRVLSDGAGFLVPGNADPANAREQPVYARLLQDGYITYHQFADEEQVTPTPRGVVVASIMLLLAAVPGLGRQQKGRGLNFTGMSGSSR